MADGSGMSNPTQVTAEKLGPCMVYLADDGQHMLVQDAGENADGDKPGGPTCFFHARSLLSIEEEHGLAVSRRKMFRLVDGKTAIRDAGDQLDDQIRRAEAVLGALKPSDPARAEREVVLARDRAQRDWVAQQAKRCGVRLRAG